jgi:hypothetical protein
VACGARLLAAAGASSGRYLQPTVLERRRRLRQCSARPFGPMALLDVFDLWTMRSRANGLRYAPPTPSRTTSIAHEFGRGCEPAWWASTTSASRSPDALGGVKDSSRGSSGLEGLLAYPTSAREHGA